jgi:hypothetical protein
MSDQQQRLSLSEWNKIVSVEEGESAVEGIIDEIMTRADKTLFERLIQRELIPFTISKFSADLEDQMRENFFTPDTSHIGENAIWCADEEPQPIEMDSWAIGSLPQRQPVYPAHTIPALPKKKPSAQSERRLSATSAKSVQSKSSSTSSLSHQLSKPRASPPKPLDSRRPSKAPTDRKSSTFNRLKAQPSLKKAFQHEKLADDIIVEENRRIIEKMTRNEKERNTPLYTYTHEGKIVMLAASKKNNVVPKISKVKVSNKVLQ